MFGLGFGEILLIGALLLVVVGPDRLPEVMRFLGRHYGRLRRASDELRRAFVLEADRVDAEDRYKKLQQRRKEALEARREALGEEGEGGGAVPQDPYAVKPPPSAPPEAEAEGTESARPPVEGET